ncbi:hypothetical protein PEPS_00840 [Persicobacter psychrovividus]|uniref:Uncharacterized protein n=1 Tax=Persicobacter psychrovividus TaxID=387638 RepID=A0ABM7VA56_9BACT|nr:hypothetical protein PEPS_00840 [Persicobacter psychrovividus]
MTMIYRITMIFFALCRLVLACRKYAISLSKNIIFSAVKTLHATSVP